MARTEILVFVYNILIPAFAFFFALNVIKKRPPTYEAPKIPDNHPLLPPKWQMQLGNAKTDVRFLIAVVLIIGLGSSFYLHQYGLGIPGAEGNEGCFITASEKSNICMLADKTSEFVLEKSNKPANYFSTADPPQEGSLYNERLDKIPNAGLTQETRAKLARAQVLEAQFKFFSEPENDVSPQTLVFGLLITISLILFIYYYYTSIYKRKIQLDAIRIEGEFKEALYILASRMGENKPVEDAMKHVRDFLPTYKVSSEVFGRTVHNIEVLGMPLNEALFDQTFGSLKDNPSSIIKSSMRLVVDSVQLGVDVASRTIVSLSLQLANQEKVSQSLKALVSDVTQMMRLMAVFVGPAILGVTVALQKVVMLTLSNVVVASQPIQASMRLPTEASGFESFTKAFSISPETMQALVTPTMFLVIVAVYVIEIVVILMYFTSKVEEDNDTAAKISIAKSLPISVLIFLAAAILSSLIIGSVF